MNTINNKEMLAINGGINDPFAIAGAWWRGFCDGLFGTDSGVDCD